MWKTQAGVLIRLEDKILTLAGGQMTFEREDGTQYAVSTADYLAAPAYQQLDGEEMPDGPA